MNKKTLAVFAYEKGSGRGASKILLPHVIGKKLWPDYIPDRYNFIDHINRDRLDNTRGNLRKATPGQNQANRVILRTDNSTGFQGVWKHRNRYQAEIVVNYQKISLGGYATPQEAHEAYLAARKHYFGEFAADA